RLVGPTDHPAKPTRGGPFPGGRPCPADPAPAGAPSRPGSRPHRSSRTGARARSTSASETEAAELLGVALPVLGDLDVEVEEDLRAEQRLDPAPGTGADLPQPRAAAADDDRLLGVARGEDDDPHVDQRWLSPAPLPPGPRLDHHRQRARQLLAGPTQRR